MKSKDIALIIVAVVMGVIVSVVVDKFAFASSTSGQQVEVVPTISGVFPQPNTTYFNVNSIDPTQFISIGNSSNTNPFNASSSN